MRSGLRSLLLVAASAVLGACGVGGVLAASGGGGGGGGGGSDPPPPPTVTVTNPPGPVASNLVRFAFQLRDPQVKGSEGRPGGEDDPRVRVVAQWQFLDDGDVWRAMTESPVGGSEGTRGLTLGQHAFVWDTLPDLAAFRGRVRVRMLAEYEDTAGLKRRFRSRASVFTVDNRLTATLLGEDVQPASDVDTFPVDLRGDGDGFVVAALGANIVERVDADGQPRRVAGFGVPGDTVGSGRNPGVARLPTLLAVVLDGAGNLYTNHGGSILVTNLGASPLDFGTADVPPQTMVRGISGLSESRGVRFHPSGALLFLDGGDELVAFNPQDPSAPGATAIVLAGVSVAPGTAEVIAGGGGTDADGAASLQTRIEGAVALAVGPDGEIYYAERTRGRVRVVNPGAGGVVLGGVAVAPGTVRSVAGSGVLGFSGDGGPAVAADFNLPGSLDVAPDRSLFVADTANRRVRLVNLGIGDVTFAETTVAPGNVDTVVGGGTGGVGGKARGIQLAIPNGVALDDDLNLLVADERSVIFVNGSAATITSYGKTTGGARTARVYDALRRGGTPLADPRALHANSSLEVLLTDRTTVRAMNLGTSPRIVGGNAADPGATVIVGGGSVPGFAGDGGSARSAAFAFPSALAREGPRRLFVADTGNDRIRFVNLGDPRLGSSEDEFVLGQVVGPGDVTTVVGGATGPLPADGDGGPALAAVLDGPEGVEVDAQGLVWVADTLHHRIRVVNPGPAAVVVAGVTVAPGEIETIVGNGAPGPATEGAGPWQVASPAGLAVDTRGVVYFADRGNARVRALNTSATAVTLAGVTIAPDEVATLVGSGVVGNSGDGGSGPAASVTAPRALFVQSRTDGVPVALYLSDEGAHVVRLLNLTSDDDLSVAIDFEGRVLTTVPAAGIVTVAGGPNTPGFPNAPAFGGDGEPAERARFSSPFGIVVTLSLADGTPAHFFVADLGNRRLRRFAAPPLVKTN